jgi:fibronectin-binding autotransporter adhesin
MRRTDSAALPGGLFTRRLGRQTAVLLTATCLTSLLPTVALTQGGAGGGGASGGTGFTGNAGTPGSGTGGGGGGGGGAGGGSGGSGGAGSGFGTGGTGGTGGFPGSPDGTIGAPGTFGGGGGGGGGGWNGNGAGAATISNGSALSGGTGGMGGNSMGGGGGGGAGGYGAVVTGSGQPSSNIAAIAGGSGGVGGSGSAGGSGGGGGVGVQFTASGASFTNSSAGTIAGGSGNSGGNSGNNGVNGGNGGTGGAGLQFTASGSVTNFGTIFGASGGGGGRSGNAPGTPAFGGTGGAGGAGVSLSSSFGSSGSVTNSGTISGATGGGGGGSIGFAGGGVGGNGGAGVFGANGNITNSGTISGASGGSGGSLSGGGSGDGGAGGAGGAGVQLTGLGSSSVTNSGTISGGNGGAGGAGQAAGSPGAGGAGIVGFGIAITNSGTIMGGLANAGNGGRANAINFAGSGSSLTLLAGSTIIGNVSGEASILALGGSTNSSFAVSAIGAQYQGFINFQKTGGSTWTLTGSTTAVTPWTISAGTLSVSADANLGSPSGTLTLNGGTLQSTATFSSNRNVNLGGGNGTFDTASGTVLTLNGAVGGTGSFIKQGGGTLTLTGSNSYGGATVSAGTLMGNTASLQGNILNNAAVVFNQTASGTYGGVMSGTGTLALQGGGTLVLTGANTYIGATSVNAGTLAVNGSLTSSVTVGSAGTLGGSGTIAGTVVSVGAVAPGNSIGTLTVNGSYINAGGTYQVEVNAAGQGDRLNVTGAPGIVTIVGGTVNVTAQSGSYNGSTKYTIVNATGGVSGTFSNINHNLNFLTPSLSYDANNVFLTLALSPTAFSGGGITPNQKAVGTALDRSHTGASGDFATVVGALTGLTVPNGPAALDALSGQPIANFGTVNVQSASLFMNALGQQMALARGGQGSGQRQALAQACDIAACDAASPFSVWGSLLGGVGSVQGDGNASTLTYNMGGGAAGIDYRIDPRFLVGIGAGYTHGTQWVNNFTGQGWSDSVSIAAYGSFTQAAFYADVLAGYAYSSNQLQRQITIPGLQPRTASGSAGANQFLGQVETGYRIGIYAPARATLTPFARLQGSTVTQNGFDEFGAQSLNLNVRQQTTNSLRTLFGADLAGTIGFGNQRQLELGLRLGWQHEYANTARPMTAAFAGAPFAAFTAYGATPQRDAAVIGFSARTNIAEAAQLYLRYDGEIASGTDNHTLMAGVRFTW